MAEKNEETDVNKECKMEEYNNRNEEKQYK